MGVHGRSGTRTPAHKVENGSARLCHWSKAWLPAAGPLFDGKDLPLALATGCQRRSAPEKNAIPRATRFFFFFFCLTTETKPNLLRSLFPPRPNRPDLVLLSTPLFRNNEDLVYGRPGRRSRGGAQHPEHRRPPVRDHAAPAQPAARHPCAQRRHLLQQPRRLPVWCAFCCFLPPQGTRERWR